MADTTLSLIRKRKVRTKYQKEAFALARDYCCGEGHRHLITFDNLEPRKRGKPVEVFCQTCAEALGTHQVVCWLDREWVEMHKGAD